MLRERGYTVVMVEQNFRFAAPLADRFYVMEHGRIVEKFGASELEEKMPVLNRPARRLSGRTATLPCFCNIYHHNRRHS
jgi:ABC-type dipeptide/oligopeptide/nickel transport system ATPase subunit